MALQFFNAKPYYNTEPVRDLMWAALPYPNDEMLDRLLQRYHDDDDMRLIGAIGDGDNVLGIVGLKVDHEGAGTILHLRVHDDLLRQGIGSAMVMKVIDLLKLHRLDSRSAEPLLPFYSQLGFTSWVIGEKPRGTKWYGVRWEGTANDGDKS
ncbi:MAG: GNAT family N-acetyltransferase [Candidatus Kapaibacterium sp.]